MDTSQLYNSYVSGCQACVGLHASQRPRTRRCHHMAATMHEAPSTRRGPPPVLVLQLTGWRPAVAAAVAAAVAGGVFLYANPPRNVSCPEFMTTVGVRSTSPRSCGE
jgi:hypothetical protein